MLHNNDIPIYFANSQKNRQSKYYFVSIIFILMLTILHNYLLIIM